MLLQASTGALSSVARYLPWRQVALMEPRSLKLNSSLIIGREYAGLWTPVKGRLAKLQDSVHQGSGGGGHVERSDPAALRQRDELVAAVGHTRAQAAALRAEHEHHPPAVVGLLVGRRGLGRRRRRPRRSRSFAVRQPVGQVAAPAPRADARPRPLTPCTTAAVTSADRRSGITTPARRRPRPPGMTAPRLCGSWTSSSASTSASSARAASPRPRTDTGPTSAQIPWCSGEPQQPSSSRARRSPSSMPPSHTSSAARSLAHTRCTRRLPRSASRTGLRP